MTSIITMSGVETSLLTTSQLQPQPQIPPVATTNESQQRNRRFQKFRSFFSCLLPRSSVYQNRWKKTCEIDSKCKSLTRNLIIKVRFILSHHVLPYSTLIILIPTDSCIFILPFLRKLVKTECHWTIPVNLLIYHLLKWTATLSLPTLLKHVWIPTTTFQAILNLCLVKSLPRLEYIKYKRQEARRQTKSAVKHQGGAQGESLTVVKIVQSVGIVSKLGNKSAFRKTFHAGKCACSHR